MVTYDETKRQANMQKHDGIDLAECECIFDSPMLTLEDTSDAYGEQRLKSLGWLDGRVVVLIWTDREAAPHLISCRFGDKHETKLFFDTFV